MLAGLIDSRHRSALGGCRRPRGFTLVELMITIIVVAILATLAAPSFVDYVATARVRNASYDLVGALQLARSEAIKRNCFAGSPTCLSIAVEKGATWTDGWTVHIVPAGGGAATVFKTQDAYSKIAITSSPSVSTVSYLNDGRVAAGTVFKIEPAITLPAVTPRCVTISLAGVPTSKVGGC